MTVAEIICCCKTMKDHEKDCNDCPCASECDYLLRKLHTCEPWQLKEIVEEEY